MIMRDVGLITFVCRRWFLQDNNIQTSKKVNLGKLNQHTVALAPWSVETCLPKRQYNYIFLEVKDTCLSLTHYIQLVAVEYCEVSK